MHSRDAVIVVDGESARLLFALNDAADEDGAAAGPRDHWAARGAVRRRTARRHRGRDRAARSRAARRARRGGRGVLAPAAHRSHRAGAGRGRRPAGRGPDGRARRAPRLRLRAARPGSRGPGAGRPADREPTVLLHRRPRMSARPSCWPVPSAAGSPASSAGGQSGSTCTVRPRAWSAARSAGPAATCSTGWPRRRGRCGGRSSSGTPTARTGYGPRCGPRPSSGKRRRPRRRRRKENWPNGRRRFVTSWACSTRPRRRAASVPSAVPMPARRPGQLPDMPVRREGRAADGR